jgi:predicted dehydrogenase
MATLKFEGGETAYIEGAYLNPSGRGLTTEFKAYGEHGLLELYPDMDDLKVTLPNAQEEHFRIPSGDGYYNEIAYFAACITENKTPDVITVDEAIESLKVALAIRESVAQRKWLAL